jgi:hypothetical protein
MMTASAKDDPASALRHGSEWFIGIRVGVIGTATPTAPCIPGEACDMLQALGIEPALTEPQLDGPVPIGVAYNA